MVRSIWILDNFFIYLFIMQNGVTRAKVWSLGTAPSKSQMSSAEQDKNSN